MAFSVSVKRNIDTRITIPVTVYNEQLTTRIFIRDALWDTGASRTSMSIDIAEAAGIDIQKHTKSMTASGLVDCYEGTAIVQLQDGTAFKIKNIIIINRRDSHMIIGMDIIGKRKCVIMPDGENITMTYG